MCIRDRSSTKLCHHIIEINRLISDRINNCKSLFPIWIDVYKRQIMMLIWTQKQNRPCLSGRSTLRETSGDLREKTMPERKSGWISNLTGRGIIGSVSYTHLDVYKRQPLSHQIRRGRIAPSLSTSSLTGTYAFLYCVAISVFLTPVPSYLSLIHI